MIYVILALAWGVYFFLHSFLATDRMKNLLPFSARTYRLIYSAFSVVALLGLLFFNGWIGGEAFFKRTNFIEYLSLFFAGAGVLIINAAFKNYSLKRFIGLEKELLNDKLITNGINSWVRHPLYSGTILITIGFFLFDSRPASLVSVLCIWIYLVIGIRLEENKLIARYGDQYTTYKNEVAAIIPFVL